MNVAAQYGHLDEFLWFHENRAEGCSARAVSLAAINGHLGVIRWIIHNMPHSVLPGTLHFAIGCNQLKVAKWLHEQVQADWEGNLVESATHYGSRELATWAANLFPEQCTPAAMDSTALSGYTELFLAFHHANRSCTTDANDNFAARGDFKMVRWASRDRNEGCTIRAMDDAAAYGHLAILRWLHEQGEAFTIGAMDGAAANGYLHILKWLHDNRSEGSSTEAMDEAAHSGHFATVRWLHASGASCTEYAMDAAAAQGHFEIVVFLHDKRYEGCSRLASTWAADYGHLEILQWLRHHYPAKFNVEAEIRAAPSIGWDDDLLQHIGRF